MKARTDSARPSIVIIGGGFGGAYSAQALERLLGADEADVLLIDRNNYFIFYPLLLEAGTGNLEPRHAVVSIRSFLSRTRFAMGEVTSIDLDARRLTVEVGDGSAVREVAFDHLVLAPGSVTRLPPVPGLREHGFEIKTLSHAVTLRDRAIRKLELADMTDDPEVRRRLLHFVIVGANFTGVEAAGEFDMFLKRAVKHYDHVAPEDVRVSLIELGDRILPALEPDLSEYAATHLRRRGVSIELGTSIDRVEEGRATLSDGRVLATDTVIWCAGIAPSPMLADLDLPKDRNGYVVCERDLRVQGRGDVWAIGDSAVNIDRDGNPYPATAQHATRQGAHVAKNIARILKGRDTLPCDLVNQGAIAALGCRSGVAKVLGVRLSGFPAWFMFRTVYLLKMPGLARKLRVALDWTMDLFFAKDTVQLGLSRKASGVERPTLDEGRSAA